MDKSKIQKLRELPIEGVARRLGLHLVRHMAHCPLHNDSVASLNFSVSRNSFRCFSCSKHGGTIDLVMEVLHKDFCDACRWLADENNIILTEYTPPVRPVKSYPPDIGFLASLVSHPTLNAEARHFLFDERKIDPRVVEWCGISSISQPTPCWRYGKPFYDAPSLLFPYRDRQGNVMNVQSRYLGSSRGGSPPRFRFPPNGSIHVFNLPILNLLEPGEPLYVSEGITDSLALLSAGVKAIAIPSATLLKKDDLQQFSDLFSQRATTLHIYPDQDEAGDRLFSQLAALSVEMKTTLVKHDLPSGCKDFGQYWSQCVTKGIPVTL